MPIKSPTPPFRFQQFTVEHARSAMKVCTDATLFGAMAPLGESARVLDIGAGSGLLSLLCAQRGAGSVTGVECDPEAAVEAHGNFQRSAWATRLQLVEADIHAFAAQTGDRFDLVICNPPFFAQHTPSIADRRRRARHEQTLTLASLTQIAARLLEDDGLFYVLLPAFRIGELTRAGEAEQLFPHCITAIRSFADAPVRLTALSLGRGHSVAIHRNIPIYRRPGEYSDPARHHLEDLLLRFRSGD